MSSHRIIYTFVDSVVLSPMSNACYAFLKISGKSMSFDANTLRSSESKMYMFGAS